MNRSQKKSISERQNKKRAKLLSACLAGGEKRGWLVIALSSNVSSSEQQAAPTPAGLKNDPYVTLLLLKWCKEVFNVFFSNHPGKMLLKQIFHKQSFVKSSQHPANLKPAQEILNNECKGCVGLERDPLTRF